MQLVNLRRYWDHEFNRVLVDRSRLPSRRTVLLGDLKPDELIRLEGVLVFGGRLIQVFADKSSASSLQFETFKFIC